MAIETLDDIVEELADKFGIYGTGDHPVDSHPIDCKCRLCFTTWLKDRIIRAVYLTPPPLPKVIERIKTRLVRLEESTWGMSYDTAKDIVDGYIEATKENPNIEASPSVLLAEKILGV